MQASALHKENHLTVSSMCMYLYSKRRPQAPDKDSGKVHFKSKSNLIFNILTFKFEKVEIQIINNLNQGCYNAVIIMVLRDRDLDH